MRTTITIGDDLLKQARQAALKRSCTLSTIVEEALRKALAASVPPSSSRPTRLVTFRGRGLREGLDLDDSVGLLDTMDGR
jgi:Arc/MetJ family transcription regulator